MTLLPTPSLFDMSDIKSTKVILANVEALFTRDDDIRDIDDVSKMQKEIQSYYQSNIASSKTLIKQVTQSLATKEATVLAQSREAHISALKQLQDDKEIFLKSIEDTARALQQKEVHITEIKQRAHQLQAKEEELRSSTQVEDMRTAYSLSLYNKISNITWDYKKSLQQSTLAGCKP